MNCSSACPLISRKRNGFIHDSIFLCRIQATIISLSHTLLADALVATPPVGTAVRSCAEALARDAAPIRDISLASRLVADVRPGPGGLPAGENRGSGRATACGTAMA